MAAQSLTEASATATGLCARASADDGRTGTVGGPGLCRTVTPHSGVLVSGRPRRTSAWVLRADLGSGPTLPIT